MEPWELVEKAKAMVQAAPPFDDDAAANTILVRLTAFILANLPKDPSDYDEEDEAQRAARKEAEKFTYDYTRSVQQYRKRALGIQATLLFEAMAPLLQEGDAVDLDDIAGGASFSFDAVQTRAWLDAMDAKYRRNVAQVRTRWPADEQVAQAYAHILHHELATRIWGMFDALNSASDTTSRTGMKRALEVIGESDAGKDGSDAMDVDDAGGDAPKTARGRTAGRQRRTQGVAKKYILDAQLERVRAKVHKGTDDAASVSTRDSASGTLTLADVALDHAEIFTKHQDAYVKAFHETLEKLSRDIDPEQYLLENYRALIVVLFRPLTGTVAVDAPLLSNVLLGYVNAKNEVAPLREFLDWLLRQSGVNSLSHYPSVVVRDLAEHLPDDSPVKPLATAARTMQNGVDVTLAELFRSTPDARADLLVTYRVNFFYFAALQKPWLEDAGGSLFRVSARDASKTILQELTDKEREESLTLELGGYGMQRDWILDVVAGSENPATQQSRRTPTTGVLIQSAIAVAIKKAPEHLRKQFMNELVFGIMLELLRMILAVASNDTLATVDTTGLPFAVKAALYEAHADLQAAFNRAMVIDALLPRPLRAAFLRRHRLVIGTGITFPPGMGLTKELIQWANGKTGAAAVVSEHPLLADHFKRFCARVGLPSSLLMPGQLEALARWAEIELSPMSTSSFRGGLFVMEAGSGKTLLGLVASLFCNYLRGTRSAAVGGDTPTSKTLIIGPCSAELSWCKDSVKAEFFAGKRPRVYTFDMHRLFDDEGNIVVVPYRANNEIATEAEFLAEEEDEEDAQDAQDAGAPTGTGAPDAVRFDAPDVQFVFVPIEFMDQGNFGHVNAFRLRALLCATRFRRLILDESHLLSRRDRRRWLSIHLIPRESTWALTATPFRTNAASIMAQLRMCGFNPTSMAKSLHDDMNSVYLSFGDMADIPEVWHEYAVSLPLFTANLKSFAKAYAPWKQRLDTLLAEMREMAPQEEPGLVWQYQQRFKALFLEAANMHYFTSSNAIALDELVMPFVLKSTATHVFRPPTALSAADAAAADSIPTDNVTVRVVLNEAERLLYASFYKDKETTDRVARISADYLLHSTKRTTEMKSGQDLFRDMMLDKKKEGALLDEAVRKRLIEQGKNPDDLAESQRVRAELKEDLSFQGAVVTARLAAISMRLVDKRVLNNVRANLAAVTDDFITLEQLEAPIEPIDRELIWTERKRTTEAPGASDAAVGGVYQSNLHAHDPSSKYEAALTYLTEALHRRTPFRTSSSSSSSSSSSAAAAASQTTILESEPIGAARGEAAQPWPDKVIVFCSWAIPLYTFGLYLRDYAKWRPRNGSVQKLTQRFRKVDETTDNDDGALVDLFDPGTITYAYYDGQTSPKERQKLIELFSCPETNFRVLLVNLQVGGTSLNLQVANHAVFLNVEHQYYVQHQAERRIARTGQRKPCFIRYLHCIGTVEDHVFDNAAISERIAKLNFTEALANQTSFYGAAGVLSNETMEHAVYDQLAIGTDATNNEGPDVNPAIVAAASRVRDKQTFGHVVPGPATPAEIAQRLANLQTRAQRRKAKAEERARQARVAEDNARRNNVDFDDA